METHFQSKLKELKDNLLNMAALVEDAIRNAVQSLVERESELAQRIFDEVSKEEGWQLLSLPKKNFSPSECQSGKVYIPDGLHHSDTCYGLLTGRQKSKFLNKLKDLYNIAGFTMWRS
jgi:hypothetical protein